MRRDDHETREDGNISSIQIMHSVSFVVSLLSAQTDTTVVVSSFSSVNVSGLELVGTVGTSIGHGQ